MLPYANFFGKTGVKVEVDILRQYDDAMLCVS